MTDHKGFLRITRQTPPYRPVETRVQDHRDVVDSAAFTLTQTRDQATRCMGCGVPFCHSGCPLGNQIPDFNEAVYREDWALAYEILQQTNPFPEFTGRICPAPCEHACVLGINQPAVAIEHVERTIAEQAFARGYVRPRAPRRRTGRKVAIIGSGPAGLAAAAALNQMGHFVTVFERDEQPGGLLRYGIPDFKLEKDVVSRRIAVMEAEGIRFQCNTAVGKDISGAELLAGYDAVLVCTGAAAPKPLELPGRALKGIYPAMEYLTQQNRRVAGATIAETTAIWAAGKNVVVIGGGDTGSDCVGTANRQGAVSVHQFQYRLQAAAPDKADIWPLMPMVMSTSSSHEEGCARAWGIQTKAFVGDHQGNLKGLLIADLQWATGPDGKYSFQEIAGSEREIPCQLALIATGYTGVEPGPIWTQLGLEPDARGLVPAEGYRTSQAKVFAGGDARRGQSLVVWAIAEGLEMGKAAGDFLAKL